MDFLFEAFRSLLELTQTYSEQLVSLAGVSATTLMFYRLWRTRREREWESEKLEVMLQQVISEKATLEYEMAKREAEGWIATLPLPKPAPAPALRRSSRKRKDAEPLNEDALGRALNAFETRQDKKSKREFWLNTAMSIIFFVLGLAAQPLLQSWFG